VAALIGFLLLPLAQATLWLIFLVVAFPVSVGFISGTLGGTNFSPQQLVEIYKESVNALPKLLRLTRDPKDPPKR
jgi:hypothetical protein